MSGCRRAVSIAAGNSAVRTRRSIHEPRLPDCCDPTLDVGAQQPFGVVLVLHLMPDPHERPAAKTLQDYSRVRVGEIDPADDAEHERRRLRDCEQAPRLVERADCLYQHRASDTVLMESWSKIIRTEAAPNDCDVLGEKGILGDVRVPEMLVRVDDHAGTGASPGIRPSARRSSQSPGGSFSSKSRTSSATSAGERHPARTHATAG